MATITTKHIIDELIANNGCYPGDPQIFMIVEYTTPEGNTVWGVTHKTERDPLRYLDPSPFVINPRLLWCVDGWLC